MSQPSLEDKKRWLSDTLLALSTPTESELQEAAAVAAMSQIAPDTSLTLLSTRPFVPLVVSQRTRQPAVPIPDSVSGIFAKGFLKVEVNISSTESAPRYELEGFPEAVELLTIKVSGDTLHIEGEPHSAVDHDDLSMPFLVTVHVYLPKLVHITARNAAQISGVINQQDTLLTCEAQQYALFSMRGTVEKMSYIGSHRSLGNLSNLVIQDLCLVLINSAKFEGRVDRALSGEVQDTSAALCLGTAESCTLKWGSVNVNVVLMLNATKNWTPRADLDSDDAIPSFSEIYNPKLLLPEVEVIKGAV